MPNTEKQLTAMQILRKRLDNQTDFARNQKEMQFICDIINDIDTELLATERQQLIDFGTGCIDAFRDGDIVFPDNAAKKHFIDTFKTQE